MKRLLLIRHGHALPATHGQGDRERPLSPAGEREITLVADRLAASEWRPQRIVSSSAPRALTSAAILARQLGMAPAIAEDFLYLASSGILRQAILRHGGEFDCIAIVGHNPGLTQLVRDLAEARVDELPTAGVAGIGFAGSSWRSLGEGRLDYFDAPLLRN